MSNRILLALDGSAMDAAAFDEARRIAAGGAEIHLLHVVPSRAVPVGTPLMGMVDVAPDRPIAMGGTGADAHVTGAFPSSAPASAWTDDEPRIYDQAVRYLEGYRRRLPGVPGQDLVRTGAPADVILDVALMFNIDLIVMSTHARTGIARWFLGSVSDAVLRRSQLPVLLVPKGIRTRPERLRRILVPLTGAPESRAILSVVKPLALRLRAEILLLEVVNPIHRGPGLEDVGRDIGRSGASWRALTVYGDPTEEILRHVKARNVDLIAMSAPVRKGAHLFHKSVPGAVLARMERPILLQNPVIHAPR
jgi:nucleotide-binding universal stress UspA family protein